MIEFVDYSRVDGLPIYKISYEDYHLLGSLNGYKFQLIRQLEDDYFGSISSIFPRDSSIPEYICFKLDRKCNFINYYRRKKLERILKNNIYE